PQSGDMTTMTVPEPLEDRRRSAPQAVDPPEPRSVGRWASRIGRFLAYGFLAMLLGAVGFSLVLGLLSAGISTVVVWIGLPILVAGVLVAHGFARAERAVQSAILGTHLPAPAPVRPSPDAGRVRPCQSTGLAELMGVPAQYALAVDMGLQLLVGLLCLVTLGPVVRGLTVLHQSVARGLLSSRYQEQQQLLRTERSRAAGRSAE